MIFFSFLKRIFWPPKIVGIPADENNSPFYQDMTVDVLARTIYGEARGQSKEGLKAVANVVINRVKIAEKRNSYWWGNNIIQVCQKPYQFSCWNRTDPNLKIITNVTTNNKTFAQCVHIASLAAEGDLKDNTKGATHYHAHYVSPYWAKDVIPVKTIGDHIFYKL